MIPKVLKHFFVGDVQDVALVALDAPAGIIREVDLDNSSEWTRANQQTALRTLTRRGLLEHKPARSESNWRLDESWVVKDRPGLEAIARGG